MATQLLADAVLNWAGSGESFASDPVFLLVFFVLGYRKLFSETSTTTVGSIILLTTLSVAAACFVRSVGVAGAAGAVDMPAPPLQPQPHAPTTQPPQTSQTHDTPKRVPASGVDLPTAARALYHSFMTTVGTAD